MPRLASTAAGITAYAVLAAGGVSVGRELALQHHHRPGAIVLAASNNNGSNFGGKGNGHHPFNISSTTVTGLVPGAASSPLPITLTSTDNSAYQLLTLRIDVNNPNGCSGASNLVIAGLGKSQLIGAANAYDSSVPGAPQYLIPKNGSLSLAGVTIRMLDLLSNQDKCASQTFTLSYSGTATQGN
jgi:hypothetical protein